MGVTPTIASVSHDNIQVLADVDDVLIIGKPTDVIKASELLDSKLAKIGLKTCPGKEKFISFHPEHFDDSKTLEDLPADTEIAKDGFTFAGTPIARDNPSLAALVAPVLSETKDLLSLLSHPLMPHYDGYHFLQQCANAKANHLVRVLSPDAIEESNFAKDFDELITAKLMDLINCLSLPEKALIQAGLPFCKAGLGLRPLERKSNFAFIAAAAATSSLWLRLFKDGEYRSEYARSVQTVIERVIDNDLIHSDDRKELLPDDDALDTFFNFYTTGPGKDLEKIQRCLTLSHESKLYAEWNASLSIGDRARATSASQKFASAWLTGYSKNRINNSDFETAVRLRLLPSNPFPRLAAKDSSAVKHRKLRHKLIAKHIATWALRAGAERAETEPKYLDWSGEKTPDIDIILGHRRLLVDVAVIHPTCKTYVRDAAAPLGACRSMVDVKLDKYEEMASNLDADVVPAVLETYGALTTGCISLFKAIANYSFENPYCLWTRGEIYKGLVLDVSTTLQIWNARLINAHHANIDG